MILEEGLLSTLHMLADSSHLAPAAATQTDSAVALRDYVALLAALREHGVAAASLDDERARDGHTQFRIATDLYLRAYAENAGYDVCVARTLFTRRDRDSALVGQAEREHEGTDPRVAAPLATYANNRRRA
jgi:hypothetical protein